jgi:hypothetical protein
MRWTLYVKPMQEMRNAQDFSRKAEREESYRDIVVIGKIILKWIFQKYVMMVWAGFI